MQSIRLTVRRDEFQRAHRLLMVVPLLFASLWASEAHASFFTGRMLLDMCQNESKQLECVGYIEGVIDDWRTRNRVSGHAQCLPAGVTEKQVQDVVVKLLVTTPEARDSPADQIIVYAVIKAWACLK